MRKDSKLTQDRRKMPLLLIIPLLEYMQSFQLVFFFYNDAILFLFFLIAASLKFF